MSLRWRLAVLVALAVAVAVAAAAIVARRAADAELGDGIDDFLETRSADVAAALVFPREVPADRVNPRANVLLQTPDAIVQIVGPDGEVVLRLADNPTLPAADTSAGTVVLRTVDLDGQDHRMITRPVTRGPLDGGAVQVARSLEEVDAAIAGIDRRLLALGLVGTALAAVAGWLVARSTVAPVEELTRQTERISATGDLSRPVELEGDDEIGRLARSFNRMLAALGDSRDQQRRLVQDASHELRTPLTSLRTNLDLLARHGDAIDPDERARMLDDLRDEMTDLGDLVTELVDLASGDEPAARFGEVDLGSIVATVAERQRRRTGRRIEVVGPASVPTTGQADRLERAVANLVANAVKFGPADAPIEVEVGPGSSGHGRVVVSDRGPGIDPGDRAHVFDRFYRTPAARTTPGSGLGLAIVAQVVGHHHGRVWTEDRPGGGARVGFELGALDSDPDRHPGEER